MPAMQGKQTGGMQLLTNRAVTQTTTRPVLMNYQWKPLTLVLWIRIHNTRVLQNDTNIDDLDDQQPILYQVNYVSFLGHLVPQIVS